MPDDNDYKHGRVKADGVIMCSPSDRPCEFMYARNIGGVQTYRCPNASTSCSYEGMALPEGCTMYDDNKAHEKDLDLDPRKWDAKSKKWVEPY